MRYLASIVCCTPDIVVGFQSRQVVTYKDVRLCIDDVIAYGHRGRLLFILQLTHSRLFQVEVQPLRYRHRISRIDYGNATLSVPVAQLEIEVAFQSVFIFNDRSYTYLWNAELNQLLRLVNLFFVDHGTLHLGLHHLAILHIVSNGL